MRNCTSILILCAILASCRDTRDIFGTYRSNFAINGYHFQQIKLKSDSTLEFKYSGHMIYDTATARFSLINKNLYLSYYPVEVDTSSWSELRKQGITLMESEFADLGKSAPFGLLIKRKKLFLIDSNLTILSTKSDYQGRERQYFLKKVE